MALLDYVNYKKIYKIFIQSIRILKITFWVDYKKMIHDDCLVGLETMTLIVINMMHIIHGIIMYGLKVKLYTYYKVIFWQTYCLLYKFLLWDETNISRRRKAVLDSFHLRSFCLAILAKGTNGPRVDRFCRLLNRWPIWKQLLLGSLAQLETFGTSGLDYVNFLLDGQTNRQGHLYLHHPESNRSSLNGLTRVWHKLQHKQTK